jgi:uncharacterized protein
MNDIMKKRLIEETKNNIGWVYGELLWFSDDEALAAAEERRKIIHSLKDQINFSAKNSKPHRGALSPGCQICGMGGWGCNFINGLCTRNCFYCPQDRSLSAERSPMTDRIKFKDPSEHCAFIKMFDIKGVGFSGGEPLLVLDTLLAHIKTIRKECGNSIYLWVYTNGDRLSKRALMDLRDAGIDELRINISARDYDLSPVSRARDHVPRVTVEVPIIPEDFEIMKNSLVRMEEIGVDFLNIHQLFATKHNYRSYCSRNYHLLHQPFPPVYESELCALKLLLYASEQKTSIPINYCSTEYKNTFQDFDKYTRIGKVFKESYEEITDAGYLRVIKVITQCRNVKRLIEHIKRLDFSGTLWNYDERTNELKIHSTLLPGLDVPYGDLSIVYSAPDIKQKNENDGITLSNMTLCRKQIHEERGLSRYALDTWYSMYVKKKDLKKAFVSFHKDYPSKDGSGVSRMRSEAEALISLKEFEEIEDGFLDLF